VLDEVGADIDWRFVHRFVFAKVGIFVGRLSVMEKNVFLQAEKTKLKLCPTRN